MSANEPLDLDVDAMERAIESLARGPRIAVNGVDFAVIHARRLIAAVRERDAEIARLRAELEESEEADSRRYCVSCGVFMGDEPSACEDEVVCDECAEDLPVEDDEAEP